MGQEKPIVVVFGASGRTGRHVTRALLNCGLRARAALRRAEAAAGLDEGVEPCVADLRDPSAVALALQGASGAVYAAGGAAGGSTPREVDFLGVQSLCAAAESQRLGGLVLMSSAAVTHDEHPHNCTFSKVLLWKRRGEDVVRAGRTPYAIVRGLGLRDRPGAQAGVRVTQGDRIAFGEDIARQDAGAFLAEAMAALLGRPAPGGWRLDPGALRGATVEIFNDSRLAAGVRASRRPIVGDREFLGRAAAE